MAHLLKWTICCINKVNRGIYSLCARQCQFTDSVQILSVSGLELNLRMQYGLKYKERKMMVVGPFCFCWTNITHWENIFHSLPFPRIILFVFDVGFFLHSHERKILTCSKGWENAVKKQCEWGQSHMIELGQSCAEGNRLCWGVGLPQAHCLIEKSFMKQGWHGSS